MLGKIVMLQLVNLCFGMMPLSRWYRLRAKMPRFAGVDCAPTARIISSARNVMANVVIGNDTFVGHQVLISGKEEAKISIGSNADVAPRDVIISGTHEIDIIGEHSAGQGKGEPIWIQDGALIGVNSTVLPCVNIGRKSIIGAGSEVSRDIPAFTVALGNPCRPVKRWIPESQSFEKVSV